MGSFPCIQAFPAGVVGALAVRDGESVLKLSQASLDININAGGEPQAADSRASAKRCAYHITGRTATARTRCSSASHSPRAPPGDRVYIYTAGAYTTCYASTFNGFSAPITHCLPPA